MFFRQKQEITNNVLNFMMSIFNIFFDSSIEKYYGNPIILASHLCSG